MSANSINKSHNKTRKTRRQAHIYLSKKINMTQSFKEEQDNSNKSISNMANHEYNNEFIRILEELSDIMTRQGEPFRARAYSKAADAIMTYPDKITNINQLKDIKGIGSTILNKLQEYVDTGTIKVLERERKNPITKLTTVYGIGPKKAKELVDAGIETIAELKKNPELLTENMKMGLKYYDDIESRIPRSEIDTYKKVLTKEFDRVSPIGSTFEIVGSYRRGAKSSGDIDIIISNSADNKEAFDKFIDTLIEKNIIVRVLSRGKMKSLTIARLPGKKARRIDFLYASPDEYAFALLYFTGSKQFNTIQRQRANDLGYTLNEHGLYKLIKGKKKGAKVEEYFPDEKSIFEFLKMKYMKPDERIDGRFIKVNNKTTTKKESVKNTSIKRTNTTKKESKKVTLKVTKKKETKVDDNINKFKKEGLSFIKTLTESELSEMIRRANTTYYCSNISLMSDNEYDIIREYTLSVYPNNTAAKEGHTRCNIEVEKNKVRLPYEMWSMDKIKPDSDALKKWITKYKGPYVLSAKLDGVSGMYSTEGRKPKLYTRGNGVIGQDISHLIPYLELPSRSDLVIRGEFIITKERFDKKYKNKFSNARNFVAGVINQKKIDIEKVKDIDFVSYEIIKPKMKPSLQLSLLDCLENIKVVRYIEKDTVTNNVLSELLIEWRDLYDYEIDGVICSNDESYPRKSGNPEHAFAFKMVLGDQVAEAKVVDVIWTPSKDGYLKPRVQIEPITLGGVKIEFATGFNAKFIEDNRIGVGAIVRLVRSGDVIPHILAVVVPASQAQMPNVSYEWNDTRVDVILKDKTKDETVREKNITGFFRGIGVEGLSTGRIKKMIAAGFDSVPKILRMSKDDLLKVEGFQKKIAEKIYNGIKEKMTTSTLPEIMNATNIFGRGFGTKTLTIILESYPDILVSKESSKDIVSKLINVHGMAAKSAERFAEKLPEFLTWAKDANITGRLVYKKLILSETKEKGPLYKKKYVLTGFRDKELVKKLESQGMIQGNTVNKNTFIVITKNPEDNTGKIEEARRLGIMIMTPEELKDKYNIVSSSM